MNQAQTPTSDPGLMGLLPGPVPPPQPLRGGGVHALPPPPPPFFLPSPTSLATVPSAPSYPGAPPPSVWCHLTIPKDLLSAYHVPGPGLGAEDSAVNKTDDISALAEFTWEGSKVGGTENK